MINEGMTYSKHSFSMVFITFKTTNEECQLFWNSHHNTRANGDNKLDRDLLDYVSCFNRIIEPPTHKFVHTR